jgi:predicted phosphodiesterase
MKHLLSLLTFSVLISACATLQMQVVKKHQYTPKKDTSKIIHSFYLIGDAGNSKIGQKDAALSYLEEEIKKEKKDATLIFLGDNIYEKGIPEKKNKNYKLAKHRLKVQTDIGKKFPGKTIFIPGNHDWYSGLEGLKRQEKLVEKALGKNTFLPEKGCPLEKIEVNDAINIIFVDTHWYVTNWDKHPGINDGCEIKTREKFFDEFEGLLKKSQGKTTLVAMHHPMFTNGSHGGYYSFKSHLQPIPILGTIKNILRKTSGVTNTDQQNEKYNQLRKRVISLAQQNEKVLFVSGHEHSLQYIVQDNIPQIVSGSGSKKTATKNVNGGVFSYGTQGFARLDVFEDGASTVHYYSAKDRKIVFEANVFKKNNPIEFKDYTNAKLQVKVAAIYTEEEVTKSDFHKFLWGKRYRKFFGQKVLAPSVNLDTLYGGLTPVRKGGGHQSKSLRLVDKKGREYVMRALRKNAVQYLQAVAFKDQYVEGQFKKTYTQDLLLDVFTGSHPYAPFTIGSLAAAIDVYHTEPILFYVPKQVGLKEFNSDFGNELYMIEARTADGHGDKKYFGFSDEIISTDDLRENLAKDEKYILDEACYIRARLFDMLIGDWDRHQDQWRWAEFKENGKIIYKAVPRDRDQAFSVFSDGFLMNTITSVIPALQGMRSYKEDIKNPRYFNLSGYPLDMRLIKEATKSDWDAQVRIIQHQITDEVIETAFLKFPKEVRDETIDAIKRKLKGRRKNLQKISDNYFSHLNKFQVITGTDKDDWFEMNRFENGDTEIIGYRIKGGKKADTFHKRRYKKEVTKDIWIYGLDDDDRFVVNGTAGKAPINIKLIGGLNNDIYEINTPKAVIVYDHKSKKNTFNTKNFKKRITDDYKKNTYNYKKLKNKSNLISPTVWYNPDDGIKLGITNTILINDFERNPFTTKHVIKGYYFTATNGYEIRYNGEFANVVRNWNLGFKAQFNSPNYAINFFGYGNNSFNPKTSKNKNRDFNRVRIRKAIAGTFLKWRGELGARITLAANFQNFDVEKTSGRFLETHYDASNNIFKAQNFLNIEGRYYYKHSDNPAFTTLGLEFDALLGHTRNLNKISNFSYAKSSIAITHKLIPSGKLVLASKIQGRFTFGENFEFYQGATVGGNKGLRSYRNERFTGKNAFYQTTDIRYNISNLRTAILPIHIGIYSGFDYGKVWGKPNNLTEMQEENNIYKTSYGGGIFLNATNMLTTSIGIFNGNEGARITYNLGFSF